MYVAFEAFVVAVQTHSGVAVSSAPYAYTGGCDCRQQLSHLSACVTVIVKLVDPLDAHLQSNMHSMSSLALFQSKHFPGAGGYVNGCYVALADVFVPETWSTS